jgi:hypothetical protein
MIIEWQSIEVTLDTSYKLSTLPQHLFLFLSLVEVGRGKLCV